MQNRPQTLICPVRSRRRFLRYVSLATVLPSSFVLSACEQQVELSKAVNAGQPSLQGWATGGTSVITAAARTAQPFAAGAASTCALTCEATIGPCHTTASERIDISDGWNGIPMRIVLRIVDVECRPVENAVVDVWHTNHTGGYSGDIRQMCNNNQADLDKHFFRGYQRSDKDGIVSFDSCFPGWYRGRVNHVHFRVMKGDYVADDAATAWAISQLMFTDELNTAIFSTAPLYKDIGTPDTSLDTDNVVGGEKDKSPYLFEVQQIDGVLIASKTITLRSSLEESVCRVKDKQGRGEPPPDSQDGHSRSQ